jgi:hypothetical protein
MPVVFNAIPSRRRHYRYRYRYPGRWQSQDRAVQYPIGLKFYRGRYLKRQIAVASLIYLKRKEGQRPAD